MPRYNLPASVRTLAIKHHLTVRRDSAGYSIIDPWTLHAVEWTRSVNPTAAQARAMIRRFVRSALKTTLERARALDATS